MTSNIRAVFSARSMYLAIQKRWSAVLDNISVLLPAEHAAARRVDQRHRHSSTTQVSFVPPPCDELTTSEPCLSATRVNPPGTVCTPLPDDST